MEIVTKRIYEPVSKDDGLRVFVERLWPRGVKKEAAHIELWFKIISPSADLRKWFNHEPARWTEFKKRYFNELNIKKDMISDLLLSGPQKKVTLLYSAHDTEYNNAVALKEYLEKFMH